MPLRFPDLYHSGEASYAQRLPFSQREKQVAFEERNPTFPGICWVALCLTQATIFQTAKRIGLDLCIQLMAKIFK